MSCNPSFIRTLSSLASCAQTSAKKGKLWSRMISAWPRFNFFWFNWFSGKINKFLKIFEIFCFKYLTFYGGDIAGRSPAGFLNTSVFWSEAPWSSANSLAAADLVMEWMEWDDRMTGWPVKDGNWVGDLTSSQPNSGRLRTPEKKIKSQSIPAIHPRPFSVKAQMLLPVSTLEVFGAAKDVRNFLANNLGGYRGIWKGHTTKIIWQK